MFGLEVADDRLDGLSSFQPAALACRHALDPSSVADGYVGQVPASVAEVDDGLHRLVVGEDAGLLELFGERVTVIGIAGKASCPDDQVAGGTDGDAGLHAELVGLPGFPLADAFDFLGVPGVKLVLVLGLLVHQPFGLEQDRG